MEIERTVKQGVCRKDCAFISWKKKRFGRFIIVPGYGMAVARHSNALRERKMGDKLGKARKAWKVKIRHSSRWLGRMPGHMNVLLRKPMSPIDGTCFELDGTFQFREFAQADVAFL